MADKLRPPFVSLVAFGTPILDGVQVVGMKAFADGLDVPNAKAGTRVLVTPPPLVIVLLCPGMSGPGTLFVKHRTPSGRNAESEQSLKGKLESKLTMTFQYPEIALEAGVHSFDIRFEDRGLARAFLEMRFGRAHVN